MGTSPPYRLHALPLLTDKLLKIFHLQEQIGLGTPDRRGDPAYVHATGVEPDGPQASHIDPGPNNQGRDDGQNTSTRARFPSEMIRHAVEAASLPPTFLIHQSFMVPPEVIVSTPYSCRHRRPEQHVTTTTAYDIESTPARGRIARLFAQGPVMTHALCARGKGYAVAAAP
ncbi:hypothetical protein C8Q80DRAFT_1275991 [Daedaleopsis nitida]|nr:hypothetical protein C8Q80DRAFT_1275991 [Daedaleopsis nitida]